MFRVLHLADLHPNNAGTFAGKTVNDATTGLNLSLVDLQLSLCFAYDVATNERTRCDVAVIPGDLFDSPRPHMNEVRIVADFIKALALEMPVLIIPGNHDLSQNTNDASALACLAGIPNVWILEQPDTIILELGAEHVWCSFLPYPTKGRLLTETRLADCSPEEITAEINRGLVDIVRGMAMHNDYPHILLAHGSVSGPVELGEQPRSLAHDIQIPLGELTAFDYVALGHIHQHQEVAPNAWYSGSLMRQSFGEEKESKGFCVVEVTTTRPPSVAFVENPHARPYRTVSVRELRDSRFEATDQAVVRVKDQLSVEQFEGAKELIGDVVDRFPFCQVSVDLVTEDRARDAGMAAMLTMEAAIQRLLPDVPAVELDRILAKHAGLVAQEVGR